MQGRATAARWPPLPPSTAWHDACGGEAPSGAPFAAFACCSAGLFAWQRRGRGWQGVQRGNKLACHTRPKKQLQVGMAGIVR